jgi:hypothetical protein
MKDYILLDYYECMTFMTKISEAEKENPAIHDELIEMFKQDMVMRTAEIAKKDLSPAGKIFDPKHKKYPLSSGMFNYLVAWTKINPTDKEVKKEYKKIIMERDEALFKKVIEEGLDSIRTEQKK